MKHLLFLLATLLSIAATAQQAVFDNLRARNVLRPPAYSSLSNATAAGSQQGNFVYVHSGADTGVYVRSWDNSRWIRVNSSAVNNSFTSLTTEGLYSPVVDEIDTLPYADNGYLAQTFSTGDSAISRAMGINNIEGFSSFSLVNANFGYMNKTGLMWFAPEYNYPSSIKAYYTKDYVNYTNFSYFIDSLINNTEGTYDYKVYPYGNSYVFSLKRSFETCAECGPEGSPVYSDFYRNIIVYFYIDEFNQFTYSILNSSYDNSDLYRLSNFKFTSGKADGSNPGFYVFGSDNIIFANNSNIKTNSNRDVFAFTNLLFAPDDNRIHASIISFQKRFYNSTCINTYTMYSENLNSSYATACVTTVNGKDYMFINQKEYAADTAVWRDELFDYTASGSLKIQFTSIDTSNFLIASYRDSTVIYRCSFFTLKKTPVYTTQTWITQPVFEKLGVLNFSVSSVSELGIKYGENAKAVLLEDSKNNQYIVRTNDFIVGKPIYLLNKRRVVATIVGPYVVSRTKPTINIKWYDAYYNYFIGAEYEATDFKKVGKLKYYY